ncbi:MAG: tail fiber protein [Candidatus Saccharimonadales bacterium]
MKKVARIARGFTLIEVIVVMTIIGILATITAVSYNGIKLRAYDVSIQSDIDRMDALQTSYALKNNVGGKAYYSGNGVEPDLNFAPSDGNVISVTVNSSDYCIRGYNPDSSKDNIDNAFIKESTDGVCGVMDAVEPPPAPVIVAGYAGGSNVLATITPTSCAAGTAQYGIRSRTNDGAWGDYSDWSVALTSSQVGVIGTKYGYQAQARCYTSDTMISVVSEGTEFTYRYYPYDALPIATSVSGYWTTAPVGYLLEDGSAVSRSTYEDLFAAIGTTYGAGDGSTTFNLPDSRGRVAVNKNSSDVEFDTIGEKYGEKIHSLSIAGMPSHNHGSSFASNSHAHSYSFTTATLNYPDGMDKYDETNEQTVAGMGHVHTGSGWTSGPDSVAVSYQGSNTSHINIQPSIVQSFAIKFTEATGPDSILPQSTSISGYWTTAPTGYLVEDGSAVSRTTYSDLFAAIGTTYGVGNGSTTFNLPDSRGRAVVNQSSSDAEFATVGQKYGEKTHSVTITEMPSHNHSSTFASTGHTHTYSGTTGIQNSIDHLDETNEQEGPNTRHAHNYSGTTSGPNSTAAVNSQGSGSGHNEIQPSIVQLTVIKHTVAAPAAEDNTAKGTSISGYWASEPAGYLFEDGRAVSRTTYDDLFAAIGTTYGAGDGSTTFNLPNSMGRVVVNRSPFDTEFINVGSLYGFKTVTLSIAQLPSHNHNSAFASSWHGHSYSGTTGNSNTTAEMDETNEQEVADNPHTHPFSGGTSGPSGSANIANEGGDGAHNNIQPSIVQKFAIRY